MADAYYKNYLKELAVCINLFWIGNEEQAFQGVIKADKDLDNALGKHVSKKMVSNLEGWLKKWKAIILSFNNCERQPSPSAQEFVEPINIKEIEFVDESPINTSLYSDIDKEVPNVYKPPENLIEDQIHQIHCLYDDDKIMEAFRLLDNLKNKYNRDFQEIPMVKDLESDYKDIKDVFLSVQDKEGWATESTGKITVSYKNVPGTPTYSLLTEGEIDVPLFNFITLLYESDLYNTWVPFCKKSNTIAKLSRSRKIVLQEYNLPFVATRQTCLYGYGANLLISDGIVVIVSRSCDQGSTFKDVKLPDPNGVKRSVVNIMGCIVRPITYEKIHVTMISNFDPLIKIVPYKILNYFSRKLAKGIFKKIIKKAKNFEGSEYQKRINLPENKDFYSHLEKSQKEYLESLKKNNLG
jgi:hypothetical protein